MIYVETIMTSLNKTLYSSRYKKVVTPRESMVKLS